MNRGTVRSTALLAVGLLVVLAGSCGDGQQALGPDEDQQSRILSVPTAFGEGGAFREGGDIFVASPEPRFVTRICDPWISGLVLSLLPDAVRGQFDVKGVVYIDNVETTVSIAVAAGMKGYEASAGVWIIAAGSWICFKCCSEDPPCCSLCPACCDEKDLKVEEVQGP
jgi:hypothetical protein